MCDQSGINQIGDILKSRTDLRTGTSSTEENSDKSTSEWNQIVKAFEEKINAEREQQGYKHMPRGQLLKKMKQVKKVENIRSNWDWWIFYRKCEDANIPFGALFFWTAKKLDTKN